MSGLETLPPDQRAVLQLILVQGRGYDDLAATLRLDPAAVRERAHAGAAALGIGADALEPDVRGRIVDYLLGQQDDGERIVTFAELGDSPAACRWAQELRAQLAGVAHEELPEVPAAATVAATTNGSVTGEVAAVATAPAPSPPPPAPPAPAPARPASGGAAAPPRPASAPASPSGPRPSRLGGAILIAGAAALAIVLAIVLIGGDDNGGGSSGSTPTAAARAPAQTQTAPANGSPQARTIGGAVLRASASGSTAFGAALVQQSANGRRLLAVEVARLPGNGAQEIYAIWLQGASGDRFLGFVPRQVRANGTFTVSSALPRGLDLTAYSTVLVTSEGTTAVPTAPGTTVVSGPLRLAG